MRLWVILALLLPGVVHAEGWQTAFEPAMKAAEAQKAPVVVDMGASWCGPCLKFAKTTLPDEAVVARLAFNLIVGDPTIGCELLYIENDDNGIAKQKKEKRPKRTGLMKAMNDVTNHLVDKAVISE